MKKAKKKLLVAESKNETPVPVPVRTSAGKMKKSPKPPVGCTQTAISLELISPAASCVFVAGSFNEWQPERTPLSPRSGGRWVGEVTVSPGRYEYLFVVDGHWMVDPKAPETVENPYGGRNSVMTIST